MACGAGFWSQEAFFPQLFLSSGLGLQLCWTFPSTIPGAPTHRASHHSEPPQYWPPSRPGKTVMSRV